MEEHPSPGEVLPSSQASGVTIMPSPQTSTQALLAKEYPVLQAEQTIPDPPTEQVLQ